MFLNTIFIQKTYLPEKLNNLVLVVAEKKSMAHSTGLMKKSFFVEMDLGGAQIASRLLIGKWMQKSRANI